MFSKGTKSFNAEFALSELNELEVATYYIPEITQIPDVINSPLREDEHPSFRVYSPDGIKVRYYDYATGERGGMVDFVMQKFGLSFIDALKRIYEDIGSMRVSSQALSYARDRKIQIRKDNSSCTIRTQRREWENFDFEYWNSYGVPEEWVRAADIYPVSYIFIISENGYVKTMKADKYAYTFIERKDGIITEKVYQPFNKDGFKWRSGHDSSIWDLWTKLPKKGNVVIITSSRKDALCIWAQTSIPSVSLQSETTSVKPQVMQELKDRFGRVYVLYDNDFKNPMNNGRIEGEKLASLYGLTQIEIPIKYQSKDTSDLYHNYGSEITKQVIKDLIK